MSALSKEDVLRIGREAGVFPESPYLMPHDYQLNSQANFATLARADLLAENERLREQIKCGHSMELDALARERDELAAENKRLTSELSKHQAIPQYKEARKAEVAVLREQLAAAQAKIDSLMLEYCPDEMTPEQIENWGKHQKAAGDLI